MTSNKPLILGRISGLFGVKGWIRIRSYTDPREAILKHTDWLLERGDDWRPARLLEGRRQGKAVVAKLDGIEDRDTAARYVNARVAVSRHDLPESGDGSYYWADLEGLQVVDGNGEVLGSVAYLIETGANDVLVVQGDQEILIPFVRGDVIKTVDLADGVITVDWEWG